MNTLGGPSRSIQRRSPGADPGPPPTIPARSMSPAVGVGAGAGVVPRSSTASSRSLQGNAGGPPGGGGGTRRANSSSASGTAVPLSQIEKSVTHLLVATKTLLETLTKWSRKQATDTEVSDVYVRLGYEFNMACRAFTAINVDTRDLGNVPEDLRNILEATLSQEASAESLEKYLPRIRDIIVNLLHGLKRKQQKLRQKQARDKENGSSTDSGGPGRTTSTSTTGSYNSGLTTLLDEGLQDGYRPDLQRDEPRNLNASPSRRYPTQRNQSQTSLNSEQSSLSSSTMQNMPVVPPYPGDEATIPGGPVGELDSFPPPPPPPKSQQSALAALQRGGDLERRASRRYSAYQISKHLGSAPGVPMLPPQTTPIPNRGRGEVRESMRAMQSRENIRHNRNGSSQSKTGGFDSSPVRVPSRVSEETEGSSAAELPARSDSPTAQTPTDKYPQPSATLKGPPPDLYPVPSVSDEVAEEPKKAPETRPALRAATPDKQPPSSFMLENSPQTTKELTLFLQYKSKVKKFVLPEGYSELSIGRLQLAFIEKFSWNTQQNGVDLPDIYIQDPVSGVRHELEDLSDIKDRTVLVLNVEALDEVKKHIDDGLGSLKQMVSEVRQTMVDQSESLTRLSERQQETAKDLARLAAAPPPVAVMTPPADSPRSMGSMSTTTATNRTALKATPAQLNELQSLRRDLAVLRQTYSNFQSEVQGSMTALRTKAAAVKSTAAKLAIPDVEGDSGYKYVKHGRKQLNTDSDRLVTKVDDLQDLVEDLRKDVVQRGVRPLPRQLDAVSKDITTLAKELKHMDDYIRKEKPIWTKIWEKELEDVCQGRDELRLMEDLMVDLQDDLEKASETFALVEQATKEQMKDGGVGSGAGASAAPAAGAARLFSRGLGLKSVGGGGGGASDPSAAKEGVLGEVRALQPNHEDRLEAIERAEKLRQKELESRRENPLTKELTTFVGEGKLKKSGGVEEVERVRKAKEEATRREVWERMNPGSIMPESPPVQQQQQHQQQQQGEDAGGGGPGAGEGATPAE